MSNPTRHEPLSDAAEWRTRDIASYIDGQVLQQYRQPTAKELVEELDRELGVDARWHLERALRSLLSKDSLRRLKQAERSYVRSLLNDKDGLFRALREEKKTNLEQEERESHIDELLQSSKRYRNSKGFRELMSFVARFRKYSPYNNMLVRVQDPNCGYFATEKVWREEFRRFLQEDAQPLLILRPYGPVKLVYSLDETEGPAPLPEHLERFAKFEMKEHWNPGWWDKLKENAKRHNIRVNLKTLGPSRGGFCTRHPLSPVPDCRIVIHDGLDFPSRFGVLCHEMAHVLLGHLGADQNGWWPSRCHLEHNVVEVEAEATAYVVTRRLGLVGTSHEYVSSHLENEGKIPKGVSIDMIVRTAGRIEKMSKSVLPRPKFRLGA